MTVGVDARPQLRAPPVVHPSARVRSRTSRSSSPLRCSRLLPLRYHDSAPMMRVITEGMLFAAYAVAFNVIFGSTGQLFLCTGALAGVGGFMSAIFADRVGLPMVAAIVVGVAIAATVGGLLSWISVKRALGTIFVGIVTLAFSLSFDSLHPRAAATSSAATPACASRPGPTRSCARRCRRTTCSSALVVVYLVIFRLLQRSRTGWAFRALARRHGRRRAGGRRRRPLPGVRRACSARRCSGSPARCTRSRTG